MGMLGQAALVMWWDIAPGGDADFHEWHAREHFPERLGVPGFLRGRRYVVEDGEPRYFTLYELDRLEVTTAARGDEPQLLAERLVQRYGKLTDDQLLLVVKAVPCASRGL